MRNKSRYDGVEWSLPFASTEAGKLISKYKENFWGVTSHSIGCGGAYGCCEESE